MDQEWTQTWHNKEIEKTFTSFLNVFMPKIHTAKYIMTKITHANTVKQHCTFDWALGSMCVKITTVEPPVASLGNIMSTSNTNETSWLIVFNPVLLLTPELLLVEQVLDITN